VWIWGPWSDCKCWRTSPAFPRFVTLCCRICYCHRDTDGGAPPAPAIITVHRRGEYHGGDLGCAGGNAKTTTAAPAGHETSPESVSGTAGHNTIT